MLDAGSGSGGGGGGEEEQGGGRVRRESSLSQVRVQVLGFQDPDTEGKWVESLKEPGVGTGRGGGLISAV